MEIAPNMDGMLLFILLVFPGLISMHIYKLLMPARDIDWGSATAEALFYSAINFSLCLPILIPINRNNFVDQHPFWYGAFLMLTIFILPIVWPVLWVKILRNKNFTKGMQLPYPTAWDFFFDRREKLFVLVHLKNGGMIGGYFGGLSYASAFPREGDLYLEKIIKVDARGVFKEVVAGTKGLLIKKDDYEYLEFFEDLNTSKDKGGNDAKKSV